ncbi:hypothetical protein O9G_003488 [Rozella allomycis CSF55]|uniref:Uncharacterized protein n=1 Tax=Rozella allomycis (strain CSF55) TaxID=988480 RepID=A0A075B2F9_ROZAC|nr:hypothetical protein O9G_003488 [Rozella allomycis CSF55]|eukprot:EPZ35116.1 hypothetical protein O9G_003488 [Rozella allomycis CSF55]
MDAKSEKYAEWNRSLNRLTSIIQNDINFDHLAQQVLSLKNITKKQTALLMAKNKNIEIEN